MLSRLLSIPEELDRFLGDPAAVDTTRSMTTELLHAPRVATTGVGASEGPARLLAAELHRAGLAARFEPVTSFLDPADFARLEPASCHLVVFSQGICPNIRIALRRAAAFARTTLVTSVMTNGSTARGSAAELVRQLEDRGARVLRHGPAEERGLLARFVGPAVATLAALRLAGLEPPPGLAARYRTAFSDARASMRRSVDGAASNPSTEQQVAFVAAGPTVRLAHGLRWKVLEASGVPDPPIWDALQFAHGPFQQIVSRSLILCALERPQDAPLFRRFERLLDPHRHRLLRVPGSLPDAWAWFEYDAFVNALCLELGRERHLAVGAWPGAGADGPLYDLDDQP